MNIGESFVVFTTSNHTLQNTSSFTDSELVAHVKAGETYAIEVHKWVETPQPVGTPPKTPGYKWKFKLDDGLSISGNVNYRGSAGFNGAAGLNADSVAITIGTAATIGTNYNSCQFIQGVIAASGTDGNLRMQFAQNVSHPSATTLYQNSMLRLTRLT